VIQSDRISPIRTVRELESVARRFRNCLRSFSLETLGGETGFYLYTSKEKAVISYLPRINGTFVIDEIQGPDNTPISDETRADIRQIFTSHGFIMDDEEPTSVYRKVEHYIHRLSHESRKDEAGSVSLKAVERLDQLES